MRLARLTILTVLTGGLLALVAVAPARAAEGGFSATLSPEKQAAAGVAGLSAAERTALDRLVAGELAMIRGGEAPEFTGTFVSRRTEAERKSAGLDRLSTAQLEKLNEFIASALAPRPQPRERPRLKESDVLAAGRQARIHGSISVAYGWGGGDRDFWAESLWLEYYDPGSRIGLGLGLSNFDGAGFYGFYPDYYGFYPDYYGGFGRRYHYTRLPVYFEDNHREGPRGDFNLGEGRSFRGRGGQVIGHGGPRGR
jgi:hypothetical protein